VSLDPIRWPAVPGSGRRSTSGLSARHPAANASAQGSAASGRGSARARWWVLIVQQGTSGRCARQLCR
jgi:hypothetical protein